MMKIKKQITTFLSEIIKKICYSSIKVIQFLKANDVEITMCIGLFFMSYASFLLNKILGFYSIGIIFISLGVFLLKYPKGGD